MTIVHPKIVFNFKVNFDSLFWRKCSLFCVRILIFIEPVINCGFRIWQSCLEFQQMGEILWEFLVNSPGQDHHLVLVCYGIVLSIKLPSA